MAISLEIRRWERMRVEKAIYGKRNQDRICRAFLWNKDVEGKMEIGPDLDEEIWSLSLYVKPGL